MALEKGKEPIEAEAVAREHEKRGEGDKMEHKKCYWCKWGMPTMIMIGLIIIGLMTTLSFFYVYPLFTEHKEVLMLRETNSIPSIYPVSGKITGTFKEWRVNSITGKKRQHKALDIGCVVNSKIRSMANGHVEKIELTAFYGIKITVLHVSKKHRFRTVYAHLYKPMVKEDDFVLRGDVIGLSGNTGSSTGPHLHLEIWRPYWRRSKMLWEQVDPLPYCRGKGK